MLIESLRARFRKPKTSRKSRDWNAQRQASLRSEESLDESEQMRSDLSQMHWLSLVCFLEETDPQALLPTPELLARVTQEIKRLRVFDALQVTVLALEQLSQRQIAEECSEVNDA